MRSAGSSAGHGAVGLPLPVHCIRVRRVHLIAPQHHANRAPDHLRRGRTPSRATSKPLEGRRCNALQQVSRVFLIVTGQCEQSSCGNCVVMKSENRARTTTQSCRGSPGRPPRPTRRPMARALPRRARSDPRRATRGCADRIRIPAPTGLAARTRLARHPASPAASGHGTAPRAAVTSGSPSYARTPPTAMAGLKTMMRISPPHMTQSSGNTSWIRASRDAKA